MELTLLRAHHRFQIDKKYINLTQFVAKGLIRTNQFETILKANNFMVVRGKKKLRRLGMDLCFFEKKPNIWRNYSHPFLSISKIKKKH
jgi:hypothetical protein